MYYFLLNPVAGNGKVNQIQEKLQLIVQKLGLQADFAKTISPGDANHLAKVALKRGYKRIVCVGGDGTLNEVLNAVLGYKIIMGIIPSGINNFLAKSLNIPLDLEKACICLAKHKVEAIDVGQVNNHVFFNSIDIGLEAVLPQFNKKKTKLSAIFNTGVGINPFGFNCVIDDQLIINGKTLGLSVVNSNFFASDFLKNFKFSHLDNKLNCIIFGDNNNDALNYICSNREIKTDKNITVLPCDNIQIVSPQNLPVICDGELLNMATPVQVKIADYKQKIVVNLS